MTESMTAGLKHNIEAMRETHRLPSFEQVLVTLEDTLTEIEQLQFKIAHLQDELEDVRKENIDRLMQKVKLEDEIKRLQSSPTSAETDELIERLHTIRDHLHTGAVGQREVWEDWLDETVATLHRLARNQMTADYVRVSQAAAIQAQHADASMREADAMQQRAEALDYKCTQFTEALMRGMTLVDELLRENGRLCAASNNPPSVRLFAAKASWDTAMHKLLGDDMDDDTEEMTTVRSEESDNQPEGEVK